MGKEKKLENKESYASHSWVHTIYIYIYNFLVEIWAKYKAFFFSFLFDRGKIKIFFFFLRAGRPDSLKIKE